MEDKLYAFYLAGKKENEIPNALYRKYNVKKGLRNEDGTGVRVGLTRIADVVGYEIRNEEKCDVAGKLYYRGIELRELINGYSKAQTYGYEEICFLLLFGYLPNKAQMKEFCELLRSHYELPKDFLETKFLQMPGKNIMNRIQQAVLSLYDYDDKADDTDISNTLLQGIDILAKLPSILVYAYQSKLHRYHQESLVIHLAQHNLSIAENLLYMLRKDNRYTKLEAQLLDMLLIVHADHGGGNNSTFTNVVIASTGTDIYAAMVGAIGAMKGPRHGGANMKVRAMLEAVVEKIGYCEEEEVICNLINQILDKRFFDGSGLVYGMGHAIYTLSDPRSEVLQSYIEILAKEKQRMSEYAFYKRFEACAKKVMWERKHIRISSNVDFYSGFVYDMLGIPQELFTPLFVLARTVGWLAHNIENKLYDGRIVRPATKYVGELQDYVKMENRL